MTGDLAVAVVQHIADDPAVFGLGDLEVLRVLPSERVDQAGLLLEGESVLYVVDLQLGPADDFQVIRLVERWAAVRRQHARRRCFAVLVAETIEPRYRNILAVIDRAVPVFVLRIDLSDDPVRFTRVALR